MTVKVFDAHMLTQCVCVSTVRTLVCVCVSVRGETHTSESFPPATASSSEESRDFLCGDNRKGSSSPPLFCSELGVFWTFFFFFCERRPVVSGIPFVSCHNRKTKSHSPCFKSRLHAAVAILSSALVSLRLHHSLRSDLGGSFEMLFFFREQTYCSVTAKPTSVVPLSVPLNSLSKTIVPDVYKRTLFVCFCHEEDLTLPWSVCVMEERSC